MYMPEKRKTGHYAHQVDENNSGEFHITLTPGNFWIKSCKQLHDPELVEEVEELIKESCFTKAINFGNIFSVSEVFGNACLVSVSGAPGEAFSNFV
jgi:hypothetical protein